MARACCFSTVLGAMPSLWPICGISNQLLAVIAFCLGTTLILKAGKARYCWVTLLPLLFLASVTFTVGWMKIFSAKARGFIPEIQRLEALLLQPEVTGTQARMLEREILNNRVDIAVVALFLTFVTVIIAGCAWQWRRILRNPAAVPSQESPYVPIG